MVLTTPELIRSLQHEVDILLHLASKIEPSMLEYRPTPGQRSTLELLQYLTYMGPELTDVAKAGQFDVPTWTAAEARAKALGFEETLAAIRAQREGYASQIESLSEEALRGTVSPFGHAQSRGSFLVNTVLCGCAAYRTQLFLYLKACGRHELSTWNLWAGIDAPATTS